MAGISWIKVETTLPRKPVVYQVAMALGVDTLTVIGALISLLCWADGVTSDGVIGKGGDTIIDSVCGLKGLSAALIEAGWLTKSDDGVVTFCEWDTHNGENAKKRAIHARVSAKSKLKAKEVTEKCHQGDTNTSPNVVTETAHLDKIRIDKSINTLSTRACEEVVDSGKGAAELCKAYPKRTFLNATVQSAYDGCLAEGITHEVLMECLRLEQMTPAWCEQDGRYIPKLVVWLNERRFEPHLKQAQRVRPAVTMNKKVLIDDLPEGI